MRVRVRLRLRLGVGARAGVSAPHDRDGGERLLERAEQADREAEEEQAGEGEG